MIKAPDDISQPGISTTPDATGKAAPAKPMHGLPMTKAARTARMRADKMVIKRMRKR